MTFGAAPALSLGVEEELFLVDRETLEPVPLVERIVPGPGPRLKPELFACLVETTTPVCANAMEVLEELGSLRADVAGRAAKHGATVVAAGTHPLARGDGQPIVPKRRYLELVEKVGERVYRQLVCGLHVHVAVASEEACLRALEGAVPQLPVLLALSANSPFVEGKDSGARSARAGRLAELPTGGAPPALRTWGEWETATGDDYTARLWDVRPHPRYGTLEVRIADQQTDVRRSAGFAAIVQALVATVVEQEHALYDRALYSERRDDAARRPPDPGELAALRELIEPAARSLGSWDLATYVLDGRPEAERQLELGPEAALRDIAERSLRSVP